MPTLRPYQSAAISDISSFFRSGGLSCILESPTGSGKTFMFSEMARRAIKNRKKVLILTDRVELLRQSGGALNVMGIDPFFIQAGQNMVNDTFMAYIAMSQTLRRRIKDPYWLKFISSIGLVIIDECHKQEFNYLFDNDLIKKKHLIGATATPMRGGKMRQMGLDYEKIINTTSVIDLIQQGYLVNDDLYAFDAPDLQDVAIDRMKGDYQLGQMFTKFNKTTRYEGVVKNYLQICPGTKALCFCVNIEHVINTTLKFQQAGIDARFVVSDLSKPKMPSDITPGTVARYDERLRIYELYQKHYSSLSGPRDKVIKGYIDNQFPVLVNAEIATTGFDVPDIETIILNRATTSTALYLQMIGRGSRPWPKKTHFNILDFGGNAARLGTYSEPRRWSVWHEETGEGGIAPTKFCGYESSGKQITGQSDSPGCRRMIHASYSICPFCGFRYPQKKIKEIDLQAIMYNNATKKMQKVKRIRDMTSMELYEYWENKGHKTAWLWRQLWFKGGEKSIQTIGQIKGWKPATIKKAINFCKSL